MKSKKGRSEPSSIDLQIKALVEQSKSLTSKVDSLVHLQTSHLDVATKAVGYQQFNRYPKTRPQNSKTIGKIDGTGQKDPKPGPSNIKDPNKFIPKSKYSQEDINCLFETVTSNNISNLDKLEILEKAVAPCPEISIKIKTATPRSLLHLGSMVTLMTINTRTTTGGH